MRWTPDESSPLQIVSSADPERMASLGWGEPLGRGRRLRRAHPGTRYVPHIFRAREGKLDPIEGGLLVKQMLAVVFGILCFTASLRMASAQVGAAISGQVEDASGAAISGATVTVRSLETGATRTAVTNDAGNFRILSLPVGPQEVKAEKTGFKAAVRTGVNLEVGQEAVVHSAARSRRDRPAGDGTAEDAPWSTPPRLRFPDVVGERR